VDAHFSYDLRDMGNRELTPEGRPDLQGNWTNATLTPIERPRGLPRALSEEQVVALEKVAK